VHPSSLAVPFVAYGARFRILDHRANAKCRPPNSSRCRRWATSQKENILADDELLTHVILPAPRNVRTGTTRCATRRRTTGRWHSQRRARDAGQYDLVRSRGARRRRSRPLAFRRAEKALVGQPLNEQTATLAGEAAVKAAQPLAATVTRCRSRRPRSSVP